MTKEIMTGGDKGAEGALADSILNANLLERRKSAHNRLLSCDYVDWLLEERLPFSKKTSRGKNKRSDDQIRLWSRVMDDLRLLLSEHFDSWQVCPLPTTGEINDQYQERNHGDHQHPLSHLDEARLFFGVVTKLGVRFDGIATSPELALSAAALKASGHDLEADYSEWEKNSGQDEDDFPPDIF